TGGHAGGANLPAWPPPSTSETKNRPRGKRELEPVNKRDANLEMDAQVTSGVAVQLSEVSKVFNEDSQNPFTALTPITLDIKPGEFVSVVGPSGCGKSTLMLMVAGLLTPTT